MQLMKEIIVNVDHCRREKLQSKIHFNVAAHNVAKDTNYKYVFLCKENMCT